MLLIETALLAISVVLALVSPSLGSKRFARIEQRTSSLAQNRALAVALIGLSALVLRAALLPVQPIPEPIVHDEFGYLLAADTFAHGRLTNPTPPMWEHFESFSILVKPTYQCFAQPAQGIALALGKVVLGHPFWGVWLSAGLMCAAITWALQGWLPPEWALLGGVLAVLRYGVFGYWANSYWGGAIGAIGGAIVLGALPRIKESLRIRDGLLMGLGLAILANSRPYEGFVFSLPVAFALLAWLLGKNRPQLRISLPHVVLPLVSVLVFAAACMGYYQWRVTGSAWQMPYQVERKMYGAAPYLLFENLPASRTQREYHSKAMWQLYVPGEGALYKAGRTPIGFAFIQIRKVVAFWKFFLGPALTFPCLMLFFILPYGFSWRDVSRTTRFLLFTLGFSLIGMSFEIIFSPHYAAPLTALVLLLVLKAMQQMHNRPPAGAFLTRAILTIVAAMFVVRAIAPTLRLSVAHQLTAAWNEQNLASFGRSDLDRKLRSMPGPILVLVQYAPDHSPFEEWVYNEVDIDHAKVVWARDLGDCYNQRLLAYFKNRTVFRLEADTKPPLLVDFRHSGEHAACDGTRDEF